jgi:hypothetical protein
MVRDIKSILGWAAHRPTGEALFSARRTALESLSPPQAVFDRSEQGASLHLLYTAPYYSSTLAVTLSRAVLVRR